MLIRSGSENRRPHNDCAISFMLPLRIGPACRAAALAFTLIHGSVAIADTCARPSFSVSGGEPFQISPPPNSAERGIPQALTAGSFFKKNGDLSGCGCDLAVASRTRFGGDFVTLLPGKDGGTFPQGPGFSMTLNIRKNPQAIASGRFTKSTTGLDDLLVLTDGGDAGRSGVTIFVPKEDGGYERGGEFEVGKGPIGMTTGRFNDDQELDVAVLSSDRRLTILVGNGKGGFKIEAVPIIGGTPQSLAAGNFTGRSKTDDIAIATIDDQLKIAVIVVHQNDAKQFETRRFDTGDQGREIWIAAANLSAPDRRDLVVAFSHVSPDRSGGTVKVLLGKEGGSFLKSDPKADLSIDARPRAVTVADMNSDKIPDLIVSAFGDLTTPQRQDRVRIFKGIANPARFDSKPMWESPSMRLR